MSFLLLACFAVPSASGATAPLSPDSRGPTAASSGGGAVVAAATTGTSKAADYGSNTTSATSSAAAVDLDRDDDDEARADSPAKPKGNAATYSPDSHAAEGAAVPYSPKEAVIFVIVMMLGALYLAPVITNWATEAVDIASSRASSAGMWVSMASQWFTTVLYLWTIIAPLCCPNRDFS